MRLPDVRDFDLGGKKVLVRVDYDVPLIRREGERAGEREEWEVADETRIENSLPTINHLLSKQAMIILLSHLGRPEGQIVQELSLSPVAEKLKELLPQINFQFPISNFQSISNFKFQIDKNEVVLLENLRFSPGEETNDLEFAKKLATLGDFYVNDAFAVSHREHASVVALPQQFKSKSKNSVAAGLSLLKEVEILSGILEKPQRPVVVILGGVKEDKLEVVPQLAAWADWILIGGKLPVLISSFQFPVSSFKNLIVADLNPEGKDITLETIEKFGGIIGQAGTIIWAGPLGQYENEEWASGTRQVGQFVMESGAFKVLGGGDTEAALTKFGLVKKIDFISSGGGAMLEFLANGDLVGLKALRV